MSCLPSPAQALSRTIISSAVNEVLLRLLITAEISLYALGVLNFEPRYVGDAVSEVLVLGVQYPKADSGEATFLTPAAEAKIGSKVF